MRVAVSVCVCVCNVCVDIEQRIEWSVAADMAEIGGNCAYAAILFNTLQHQVFCVQGMCVY